jgi:non-ribosomal peptide synthetase component E (peptide arylation enzyme)
MTESCAASSGANGKSLPKTTWSQPTSSASDERVRIRRQRGVVVQAGHVGHLALRGPFGQGVVHRPEQGEAADQEGHGAPGVGEHPG